ncbi:MAG: thioredoxin [Candidatus Shapirobacteria bacterium]|nr:thioredoxin [Candidatus Shapirobacteria bacterium]
MINVNKDNFKSEVLDFNGKVFVDFWAPWCGPCQMLGPIMEEISNELSSEVKVVKVNVDEELDLSVKYNVSAIPTVLLFSKGELIDTFIGFKQKEDYIKAINKA